jgi:hypothetical protein
MTRYCTQAAALVAVPQGLTYRLGAGDCVNGEGVNSKFFVCSPVDAFFRYLNGGFGDTYNWYEVI